MAVAARVKPADLQLIARVAASRGVSVSRLVSLAAVGYARRSLRR